MTKARCTTCPWAFDEAELTPSAIEFLGAGPVGVWQAGEYHEYRHGEWVNGEPPELHTVILEPTGISVEAFRNMLTSELQTWRLPIPPRQELTHYDSD